MGGPSPSRGDKEIRVSNAAAAPTAPPKHVVDARREVVETVVVVLALVSLLRSFVAEAFSIPTGSMGPTLLGANRHINCPECGHDSIVGAWVQASNADLRVAGTLCQNCRFPIVADQRNLSAFLGEYGDRVIVSKYGYELGDPKRWDVVVFIYPAAPMPFPYNSYPSRTNFIKRLIGLPGEEVAFMYGDAYVRKPNEKEFAIAAKTPEVMLATRRVVFDNDEQPNDLLKLGYPARWSATEGTGVKASDDRKKFALSGDGTIAYHHLLGGGLRDAHPHALSNTASKTTQLVTDFEAYNRAYGPNFPNTEVRSFNDLRYIDREDDPPVIDGVAVNWVGDLMLECTLDLQTLAGVFNLHLTEATRQYRCEFAFDGDRKIRLYQGDKMLAEIDNPVTAPRSVDVRFANFDDRLVVWIDGKTVFGDGVPVATLEPADNGPLPADLEPAKATFSNLRGELRHLKLYRDIYYTQASSQADEGPQAYPIGPEDHGVITAWRTNLQETMARVRNLTQGGEPQRRERTFSIPPGHFMMCGDNSPRSHDGRGWSRTNFVPRQCVLGKALVVYYPLHKLPWKLKLIK